MMREQPCCANCCYCLVASYWHGKEYFCNLTTLNPRPPYGCDLLHDEDDGCPKNSDGYCSETHHFLYPPDDAPTEAYERFGVLSWYEWADAQRRIAWQVCDEYRSAEPTSEEDGDDE